jgi:hypothetical protein
VPTLPIRKLINRIVLAIGLWFCVGEVRGQGDTPPEVQPIKEGAANVESGGAKRRKELEQIAKKLEQLGEQAQAPAAAGSEAERQKAQIELMQKQIDVLHRMTKLLAEQVAKQPEKSETIEPLEEQVATVEARTQQGARRDQELAAAQDALRENFEAELQSGRWLPANVKELFLPSRNNESPLAIYGQLNQDYTTFSKQNNTFVPPTLQIHPYLLLNENWLMSANLIFLSDSLVICRMQAERFINDYLTVVAGRFYSPIGFYTERLRLEWVLKTPDNPLIFNQVYPNQLYFDGVQLRGARYLFDWPVKLEYVGFVANGLSVPGRNPSPKTYSDLSNFTDSTVDVNGAKAWGGRVGLSIPEIGFIGGLSGLANGDYDQGGHYLNLWDVDLSYHRGNWDARFEFVHTDQTTPAKPIHRQGLYAQLAYRQYDNPNPCLQKLEGVFRFDHVQFENINLQQTGIGFGGFGFPYARMPLDRNRYTLGANYWFYPSLALKLAIEWYDELGVPSLKDNGFIAQLVWGF